MKSIRIICALLLMAVMVQVDAQGTFEKVKSVKGIKVTVKVPSEKMAVMIPDNEPNERYVAGDLPAELQKDGLHLTIDGEIGAIPPNVRMIGKPFRITCVKVSAADKKKYKLSKKSYCLVKK